MPIPRRISDDPRSGRQRIPEVVEAVVRVSITVAARHRLLEGVKGLGPINVADGVRGVATGARPHLPLRRQRSTPFCTWVV